MYSAILRPILGYGEWVGVSLRMLHLTQKIWVVGFFNSITEKFSILFRTMCGLIFL
jgi:hypothetical protein